MRMFCNKRQLHIIGLMLSCLTFITCSSDDYSRDQFVDMPEGMWIEHVENRIGRIHWENEKWCINCFVASPDACINYYPVHMGRSYCKRGQKVLISGYAYETELQSRPGNVCQIIVLTSIQETDE